MAEAAIRHIGDVILSVEGISLSFGGVKALSEVSFSVREHEILAIIGPNGAGKSTLFRLIVGTYPPTAGKVRFDGFDVTSEQPCQRVQRGMSIKMQTPSVFKELPVRQNIHIALQHHVARSELRAEEDRLLDLLHLTADSAKLAGELSHGQQQWLEIGMALALKTKLLLLDEPTAGMSPDESHRTGELILRLKQQGLGVIVISHNLADVFKVADRVVVLRLGRIQGSYEIGKASQEQIVAAITGAEFGGGRDTEEAPL